MNAWRHPLETSDWQRFVNPPVVLDSFDERIASSQRRFEFAYITPWLRAGAKSGVSFEPTNLNLRGLLFNNDNADMYLFSANHYGQLVSTGEQGVPQLGRQSFSTEI